MSGRQQRATFRPSTSPARAAAPSRRQAVALVAALVLVAGAIAIASFAVKPSTARAFNLFYGSVFINDNTAPVAVDLATGKPSVRLTNAYTQVSARVSGDLDVIPLSGSTLLLDSATGEFNMLDQSGFVLKHSGGGVSLPHTVGTTSATGIPAGDSAYIVRSSASGTSVYLVGQSTVSVAAAGGKAQARASISMPTPMQNVATTAVAANSSGGAASSSALWLLVGAGDRHTIRELRVPPGSNAGATLISHDHGTVSGVAAIAASTRNPDGSGGESVAVASGSGIDVFDGSHRVGHLALPTMPGLDAILPASNQRAAFSFLYHGRSGWSLVRAAIDATGAAQVSALAPITGTDLAIPAQSQGALYTMDRDTGQLWRISAAGRAGPVPGAGVYPRVPGETTAFSQADVLARGPRVIFNSRANLEALTVFSDGSHRPVVIDKRTAVDLNSNGSALANLDTAPPGANPAPGPSTTPRPNPSEAVTDKIDCKNTTQVPHIPQVALVDKGSRSVQLQWTYPLLDRQDCAPSTYTVAVQVAAGEAPPPPAAVKVQGVDGVNLTGLFPDTQYRIVVNAYINGKHTPSAPLLVRTQPEGPAAPTGLRVATTDQGSWALTWNSCGGIAQGCVPVTSWTIVPQLCDSSGGLISAPRNGRLIGDPTTHTFHYTYAGGPGLLGASLRFTVEGVGDGGTVGDPSTSHGCLRSWAHPVPADIHVVASTPPRTVQGGTSSTTVTVGFTGSKQVALGGAGGHLTYRLLSGSTLIRQLGPTTATTASLPGLHPGTSYQVQVVVTPPGHPADAVALDPVEVQAAVSRWPALSATASFVPDPAPSSTGTLTVGINGVTSSDARGETFDLTNSQLVCGNTAMPLTAANWDPVKPLTFRHLDRSAYNGSCVAQLQLVENSSTARSPAYFGGVASPRSTSPAITIPVPDLDTSAGQFVANFINAGVLNAPQIAIAYRGGNPLIAKYATDWSIQAQYQDGSAWSDCGDPATGNPAQSPVVLDLDASCYYANYGATWQVTVTFTFFGQSPTPPYDVTVNRSGPKPVDQSKMSFTAEWSNSVIAVSYSGPYPDSTLSALQWSETISSSTSTAVCGSDTKTPTTYAPMTLSVDFSACPSGTPAPGPSTGSATYTVLIRFTDPNYGNSGGYQVTVSGTPS